MRLARRLLVVTLILGLLFVGANIVVARVAESRIAAEAKKSFGTRTAPSVKLDAFPIIVQMLNGRLGGAEIDGRDLVLHELAIAHVHVVLVGIHATLSQLTSGGAVRVDRGSASADVTAAAVNAYLKSRGYDATVEVRSGGVVARGRVRVAGRTVSGSAEGTPRLVGRLLSFVPSRISADGRALSGPALAEARRQLSFEVDLPVLPGGIRITSVAFFPGRATLEARFAGASLDLGSRSG